MCVLCKEKEGGEDMNWLQYILGFPDRLVAYGKAFWEARGLLAVLFLCYIIFPDLGTDEVEEVKN